MDSKTTGLSPQELMRRGRADMAETEAALQRAARVMEDTRALGAQTEAALQAQPDPRLAAAQRGANQQLDKVLGELRELGQPSGVSGGR